MAENSKLTQLAEKLKKRNEEELKQVEQIERDALRILSKSLRLSLEKEANTLKSDMDWHMGSIKRRMQAEVDDMKQKIWSETSAMTQNLKDHHENTLKTSQEIQEKILLQYKALLKEIAQERKSLEDNLEWMLTNKIRAMTIAFLIGLAAIVGLGMGARAIGWYATKQIKRVESAKEAQQKLKLFVGVKVYKDGITLPKEPRIQKTENGRWAVIWNSQEEEN